MSRVSAGLATATAVLLAACTGAPAPSSSSSSTTPSPTPSTAPSTAPSDGATPLVDPPRPRAGACRRLSYADAVSPTDTSRTVACRRAHTAVTFAVGSLDTLAVVRGHLLAVDSRTVQQRLAAACPDRLAAFVGGSAADRATSMLRAIWFSPTIEQADAGEDWYRCDATVLAADSRLASFNGSLAGALDRDDWRSSYGMCGTADPATPRFRRVVCSRPHTWEAVDVGTSVDDCEAPARAAAADPLTVTWSYERPPRGETQGLCWVPSTG